MSVRISTLRVNLFFSLACFFHLLKLRGYQWHVWFRNVARADVSDHLTHDDGTGEQSNGNE